MFRFIFTAKPIAGSDQAADIAGGRIEVWVNENNAEAAEAKARAYIMDYSWIVKELETSEHWPEELCPDPEKSAASFALHRKAERDGIAALFQAWPKVPRPGVYEYRPLGKPLTPDGKQ